VLHAVLLTTAAATKILTLCLARYVTLIDGYDTLAAMRKAGDAALDPQTQSQQKQGSAKRSRPGGLEGAGSRVLFLLFSFSPREMLVHGMESIQ
jgi:hypothetical protein